MDNLENFIKDWNSKQTPKRGAKKVVVYPEIYCGIIFGFKFRFIYHNKVKEEEFENLKAGVFNRSKNLFQVVSNLDEFKSGIMTIAVLPCNHGYSAEKTKDNLNIVLTELLPVLL